MKKKLYFLYSLMLFVLFFPAILAHELTHYITALILGLKPSLIKIRRINEGYLELFVEINDKKDWRNVLVYLSPLLASFIWLYLAFYFLNKSSLLSLYLFASLFPTFPSEHDVKEALKIVARWLK